MKVGGTRQLVIPPEIALGEQGANAIPPNATLIMEIALTDVKEPVTQTEVDPADYTTTDSGLQYYDIVKGDGASAAAGETVTVHYTGWLEDGTQFDSSVDRGEPFTFVLGRAESSQVGMRAWQVCRWAASASCASRQPWLTAKPAAGRSRPTPRWSSTWSCSKSHRKTISVRSKSAYVEAALAASTFNLTGMDRMKGMNHKAFIIFLRKANNF